MTMKTYFSFDLDYFNFHGGKLKPFVDRAYSYLEEIRHFVAKARIPIVAVMNHQQMLPHVDASRCDTLLNVDTHSDLCESDVVELNCGTWVAYVKWRKQGTFTWWHGYDVSAGDCGTYNLFSDRRKMVHKGMTDWKVANHIRCKQVPKLTSDIRSVGICLSPSYVDYEGEMTKMFKTWVSAHGVPYTKGRKDEHFGRKRRPPQA